MTAQLPPCAPDAERAVVSACLLAPDALATVRDVLRPDQFFDARCRLVLEAAIRVDDAGGTVDPITLAVALRDAGKLEHIGGTAALAELLDASPDLANLSDHCAIVAAKDRLRKIINVCRTHAVTAHGDVGDIEAYCSQVEKEIYDATDGGAKADAPETIGSLMGKAMPEITARQDPDQGEQRKRVGVTTGLYELDVKLGGGLDEDFYIGAGRPGMGKTAFVLSMMIAVAMTGKSAVLYSAEMKKIPLALRILSQVSKVPYMTIRSERMTDAEWKRVLDAHAMLKNLPLMIQYRTGHMIQVRTTFRRAFAELRRKFGVEPGFGAIDYAQLLVGNRPKGATREEEVASISRFCQQLPGEFNCPIMLLSQLNRAVENRPDKRPNMADLRESGSLEQDAAGIFLFYRDEYYHPETEAKGVAEVIVGKFRNGATGTIEACYDGPTMRYYSPSDGIREACDEFDDGIGAVNL